MHDGKAVSFAILMSDAFGGPTADGIDDVGRALMARRRLRRLCRMEWMTHPSGTRGFSHLFSAALAEFALHLASLQYFGEG